MTNLLYGIHDREGRHIVPAGGWCVDTVALSERPAPTDYSALRGDINWIVRINHGYGSTGTIPTPDRYTEFANACADYVARSPGARRVIIGNEPNHEQERPNGVYITPAHYAECFRKCREAIKRARPQTQVIPAPCAPYHAIPVNWLDYWREMLTAIASDGGCDGIAIHAYTRDSDPYDINANDIRMGPGPLEGQYAGFLTYVDALGAVPRSLRHLPAYITEFNELLPDGWHDANTGVVQAAYQSIHGWNQEPDAQKFQCLVLYRWPRFDKWHIAGKQGVIADFRQAVARGYRSPKADDYAPQTSDEKLTTHLPTVHGGNNPAPNLPRDWDPRLTQRGVTVHTPRLQPGEVYWHVAAARWYSEAEAGGRHHIYVETLTPDGRPVAGVPFLVVWPDGNKIEHTKAGRGFDAGNYPMSPSLNEFDVSIADGVPSEAVRDIGMGADGNPGIHTATLVTYQLATVPEASQPAPTPPAPPATVPALAHPIADPSRRIISQRFGENPQAYARFGMAGHTGIDFAVAVGTPVGAVDSGVVLESGTLPDYGEYIKIRHVWGESLYAHLSARKVEAGEPVNRGYVIGRSGNTGNSTGPHLHFAMRVYPYKRGYPWDGFSDPAPYLINTPVQPAQPQPADLLGLIKAAAQEFGVEWQLLASLAWAESSWNPRAVSSAGAKGLLQLMDATWAEWSAKVGGNDPFNPAQNLNVGAAYLAWCIEQADGEPYGLLVYNWGIGNFLSGKAAPKESIEFANKVLHGRDLLKAVGA